MESLFKTEFILKQGKNVEQSQPDFSDDVADEYYKDKLNTLKAKNSANPSEDNKKKFEILKKMVDESEDDVYKKSECVDCLISSEKLCKNVEDLCISLVFLAILIMILAISTTTSSMDVKSFTCSPSAPLNKIGNALIVITLL